MKVTLDVYGNEKQLQAVRAWIDEKITDIVYGGSKGSGKSYLGCSLIFADALTYPGTHYFIARKKLNDLRKFTIPSIHEVFNDWELTEKYYRFNGQDNYFELYNESRVYLLEAKYLPSDPLYYRFGSMQMTRGWIEESGEFEAAATNNLAASIGRWKNEEYNLTGKLLQTCNPSKNYLYREYYKKHKEGILEAHKAFIQALPQDNKRLDKGYLENLVRVLDANQKQRLLYGNWEYDDDPATLIDNDSIADYWNPAHVLPEGQKYLTIDVARKGKDKTVFRVWHGWLCIERREIAKSGLDEVVNLARMLQRKYGIPLSNVIADEDGVGGGVIDFLKCKGFVNNSSPLEIKDGKETIKPNFDNLKSQCSIKMAEMIANKLCGEICNDDKVKEITSEEMEQVKLKDIDKDGKQGIIPKDKVKELIDRSPDEWDSIMMRYWFELRPSISNNAKNWAAAFQ